MHYEKNLKLKTYPGNLSEFVKQKPEAKAYYELSSDNVAFNFPGALIVVDLSLSYHHILMHANPQSSIHNPLLTPFSSSLHRLIFPL